MTMGGIVPIWREKVIQRDKYAFLVLINVSIFLWPREEFHPQYFILLMSRENHRYNIKNIQGTDRT